MTMTIMIPLDGSPFAEHAISAAFGIARRTGATLALVRVREKRSVPDDIRRRPLTDPGPPGVERRYLDDVIARMPAAITARATVLRGDPAEELVRHAAETAASMLVVSTHGRGGVRRALLGSVADAIVRGVVAPVLLIKPPPTQPTLSVVRTFRRVLVPLDGSTMSEQVIDAAVLAAGLSGVEYELVRVVSSESGLTGRETAESENAEPWICRASLPQTQLDAVAEALRARGAQVSSRVLRDDDPAKAILDHADHIEARLIAMATHARRGAPRMVLGSVADEVVRDAPCPVLVYHPLPAHATAGAERAGRGAEQSG